MTGLLRTFPNEPEPVKIVKGEGLFLTDEHGVEYFDTTGGFTAHAIVGWQHPHVHLRIEEQLNKISHIDYKMFSDPNRESLALLMLGQAKNDLTNVFFCGGSGAEACESALHLSYQAHFESGKPDKYWYISREQSYHGATSDAMSVGDRPNLNLFTPFFSPYRKKISEHNKFRAKAISETDDEYMQRCVQELEKAILEIGPSKVGGFVAETIMGGLVGDVPPVDGYWRGIREICDKYDVHLIIDEVWCGTGTSGKFFCIDHDEISPDFLFIAKTLGGGYAPISAVFTTSEIQNIIKNGSGRIENSATFQGHSLSIAAALGVQEIVTNPGFLEEVTANGQYIRSTIEAKLSKSTFFQNVRGRGLRNSIEYLCAEQHKFGLQLTKIMKEKHQILINGKWHRICLSPSLTISRAQINHLLEVLCYEFLKLEDEWPAVDKSQIKLKNFF